MDKIEELYCLLQLYTEGKYDVKSFCDELTRILYYENGAINELLGSEKDCFDNLGRVAARYTPSEEDRSISKWYCDEEAVKTAIEKAYLELHGN